MFKGNDKKKKSDYQDLEINTIIAEEMIIEGDLIGQDSIRIDGKVKGNIRMSKGVVVGETGVVDGNIQGENVIIYGKIVGNISSITLNLKSTGTILGNTVSENLSIDLGGKLNGLIEMVNGEKEPILLEQKAG